MRGRVKFINSLGNSTGAPLQGQAILYFGDNVDRFIENCEGLQSKGKERKSNKKTKTKGKPL